MREFIERIEEFIDGVREFIHEKIVWPHRYRRAVRKANKYAELEHCNMHVILFGRRLAVMSKRDIVINCANGFFRHGVKPSTIMSKAIYVALKK